MKDKVLKFFSKNPEYYSPEEEQLSPEKELKLLRKENKELKEDFWQKTLQKFKTRRSIRKYSKKQIDEKAIYDLLEAALNSPAAGNIQNYDVIVVKDEKKRQEIGKIALNQCWLSDAPVLLVVVRDDHRVCEMYPHDGNCYSIQNTAAFIENVLLLAHTYGLGACWVEALENEVLKSYLGIPSEKEVDAIIPLGYPLENPSVDKEPMMRKVFFEQFGNMKK